MPVPTITARLSGRSRKSKMSSLSSARGRGCRRTAGGQRPAAGGDDHRTGIDAHAPVDHQRRRGPVNRAGRGGAVPPRVSPVSPTTTPDEAVALALDPLHDHGALDPHGRFRHGCRRGVPGPGRALRSAAATSSFDGMQPHPRAGRAVRAALDHHRPAARRFLDLPPCVQVRRFPRRSPPHQPSRYPYSISSLRLNSLPPAPRI